MRLPTITWLERRLKPSDEVRLIRPIIGVPVGTQGVILKRFKYASLCNVHFEGHSIPRLVSIRDLAPVPKAAPSD